MCAPKHVCCLKVMLLLFFLEFIKLLIMQIWSLDGGTCKLTLHGHQAAVSCLQFDETRIISGALDRLIKIWNISNGEVYFTSVHSYTPEMSKSL